MSDKSDLPSTSQDKPVDLIAEEASVREKRLHASLEAFEKDVKLIEVEAAARQQALVKFNKLEGDIAVSVDEMNRILLEVKSIEPVISAAKTFTAESSAAIKASAVVVEEAKASTINSLNEALAKVVEIKAVITQAIAVQEQITATQSIISTKSKHIEDAHVHADAVRENMDRALTAATKVKTDTEAQYIETKSSAEKTSALHAALLVSKTEIDIDAAAIALAKDVAQNSSILLKGLSDKAAVVEDKIQGYENKLKELEVLFVKKSEKIEELLPGATAAGISEAFDSRRKTFLKPVWMWQTLFIGAVVSIVILASTGLWQVYKYPESHTDSTTQIHKDIEPIQLLVIWASRLPVGVALVWLAIHASAASAVAKRLEEDYGYKVATVKMLIGFRAEIANSGQNETAARALEKLYNDTLATLASPPGRIYDKHKMTNSPLDTASDIAQKIVSAIKSKPPEG